MHEADIFGGLRSEGWGITTVEHREPRVDSPGQAGNYDNCIYACGRCNRARSRRPVESSDGRLLDPTEDVWSDHFELADDDQIEPLDGDDDAAYTVLAYDPNDPLKVERRQKRRELMQHHLPLIVALPFEIERLLELADRLREEKNDLDGFQQVVATARRYRQFVKRALHDLRRYTAVPPDAPDVCRCGTDENHTLPETLARQTLNIPDSP